MPRRHASEMKRERLLFGPTRPVKPVQVRRNGRMSSREIPPRRPLMGQTIACANQKGGVGKTTTVVSLATDLALAGERVLVVDLDPQGNATSGFGIDRSTLDLTVYDVMLGSTELVSTIVPTAINDCLL